MVSSSLEATINKSDNRVRGLDTLRFFLALWVVFGHLGFIPLTLSDATWFGKLAHFVYANAFSGPSAVIVFFVISGFCIHYPYRDEKKLNLIAYFSRRHIRIWVPIITAVLISLPIDKTFIDLDNSVLWSLLAEEIYYLIYPMLLTWKRKIGWKPILAVSYVGAFLVIMTDPLAGNYPSYGSYLNWILGLPCWLLGCCLAERADALRTAATSKEAHIWRWRFAAWGLTWLCSAMRFHTPIKYPWTLTLFAIFAFFWLQKEIIHFKNHAPIPFLERAGRSSYSIYLVHKLAPALYLYFLIPKPANPFLFWLVEMAFTASLCFMFYKLVEKPSHFWARQIAKKIAG